MNIVLKLQKFYRYAYKMGHFPTLKEIFSTDKKIFAYYGYLGDNNFGDELVFESAKHVFKPHILLPIRKFMPISVKIFCLLFKSKFSGVIIGGGTLIGPFWDQGLFLNLINCKKYVYIHGTGVHKSITDIEEWKSVFSHEVFGGVRGNLSKENLLEIYPDIKITGDAAFAFFDNIIFNKIKEDKSKILINFGTHFDYHGQDKSRKEIKKFIKYAIENNFSVHFLPMHDIDNQLGLKLIEDFPEIILLKQPDNFADAVDVFQNFSFVIGERLHFTVIAVLAKRPFVSLNYGKKHDDLLESINLSKAGLQPEQFSFETIVSIFENRKTFEWGNTENIINDFKNFQNIEANKFTEKIDLCCNPNKKFN